MWKQRATLGRLRDLRIQPSTEFRYVLPYSRPITFARRTEQLPISDLHLLDELVGSHIEEMWDEGEPKSWSSDVVAGVQIGLPSSRTNLAILVAHPSMESSRTSLLSPSAHSRAHRFTCSRFSPCGFSAPGSGRCDRVRHSGSNGRAPESCRRRRACQRFFWFCSGCDSGQRRRGQDRAWTSLSRSPT